MSGRRRVITSVVWAIILGALITLPLGRQRQISVEVWLVAASSWLALSTTMHIVGAAPTTAARLRSPWERRRTSDEQDARLPRALLVLEGTMISARDNDRAYGLRLRPRLKRVTDHYLSTQHGIDSEQDPERAAELLGPVAWLVDVNESGRTPELDEVEQLLDLIDAPRSLGRGSEVPS